MKTGNEIISLDACRWIKRKKVGNYFASKRRDIHPAACRFVFIMMFMDGRENSRECWRIFDAN